jgi:hypothetical protein
VWVKPGGNLAETWRKPGENLAEAWGKPGGSNAATPQRSCSNATQRSNATQQRNAATQRSNAATTIGNNSAQRTTRIAGGVSVVRYAFDYFWENPFK